MFFWSIFRLWQNHIFQPQLAMPRFIHCVYMRYTDILFRYKVWVSPRLAHTHTCRQHSHHTQRENDTTNGGLPPSVLSVPLCVWCGTCVLASGTLYVNNMSVYCTYIHTTYDFCMGNCGWRIWFLSQFWLRNMYFGYNFGWKTCFSKVVFRPRDPSKKLGHVVRISLVQFSASELHEVSSYDRLKIEKVKIRILRRQHLLGSIDCID